MDDRELLSRYLEGELGEGERRAVEDRLARDPALARELESLRGLLAAATALPRSVEPPPAAWDAIRARLEIGGADVPAPGARTRPSVPAMAAAAAVAFAILAGGFALGRLESRRAPAPAVTRETSPPGERAWQHTAEQVFAARETMSPDADPQEGDDLRRNLDIVDEAVHRLHAALEADPTNPSLQRLLNAEYKRRGALLRRAAQDASVRT